MKNLYVFIILVFSTAFCTAQGTTGYSGTGGNIDVYNYQINWNIDPDSSILSVPQPNIAGDVKIKFKALVSTVNAVSFDLRATLLIIDSVFYHGAKITATRTGNTFSLPVSVAGIGTRDSVDIFYHGKPPAAAGLASGFNLVTDANGQNAINTLSESYEDRDWWPCKADMQDKADTIDINVTVPWLKRNATDTFWVASNGTLIDSAINSSSQTRTFKYINRYPMASYLVCVSVARYMRYYRGTLPIGGFNVPVAYYLTPRTGTGNDAAVAAMDNATKMVTQLGLKYGNYGFIDPARGGKHGFYEGLTGAGGMEHQTFSAIATGAITSLSTLVHELQHQWFGDKVSFSTWNDLWLAEAFAEYSPALAGEYDPATFGTAYNWRANIRSGALAETAPVYLPNPGIASSNTIWKGGNCSTCYGSSVYDRGAMVVSMLRTLSGDTKFFNIMKQYQTRSTLQYKSASLDTMKKIFTDSLGLTMNPFFTDNVVGTGYPNNTVAYQYFGAGQKNVALSLNAQSLSNAGSATFISQPVVIHLKGAAAGNDTTITFYAWSLSSLSKAGNGVSAPSGSSLTYALSFKPTSIFYDDSLRTTSQPLNGDAGTPGMVNLIIVDLKILDFTARQHTGYNDASLTLDDNSINAGVILERSADGTSFTELGNMALQAGGTTPKKYLFNDMSPLKANNYYRAKYKNADGIFIYSRIVKLGALRTDIYTIINNPVHDMLQINTATDAGKNITFSIYDMTGKDILNKSVANAAAITDITLPRGLVPGAYIVKIFAAADEAQNIKFVVR